MRSVLRGHQFFIIRGIVQDFHGRSKLRRRSSSSQRLISERLVIHAWRILKVTMIRLQFLVWSVTVLLSKKLNFLFFDQVKPKVLILACLMKNWALFIVTNQGVQQQ